MNLLIKITFNLDGKPFSTETTPNRRLLDVIREDAGITAVREGCGEGECGACSVFLDGKLVNSCCIPIITVQGKTVTTIEGFSKTDEFEIISDAFAEAGAVQCGFCTPGFVMATAALLMDKPEPDDKEIRNGLSGNLCRCTGYTMIIDGVNLAAVKFAARKLSLSKLSKITESTDVSVLDSVLRPETIEEAANLLKSGYKAVAGGTDLMVRQHAIKKANPSAALNFAKIFSCTNIKGTTELSISNEFKDKEQLNIGSSVTLSEIINFSACPPILRESLESIAAPGIRNIATLVGNICNASPAADSLPALYLLNTKITTSQRVIPLQNFITGPGKTVLLNDEIVTGISCDTASGLEHVFRKVGTRAANALSKLSIAAVWKTENETLTDFRLAIGACAPVIVRSHEAEKLLEGIKISNTAQQSGDDKLNLISEVLKLYADLINPIDDQRSTAEYRKNTALKLVEDIIKTNIYDGIGL